MEIFFSTRLPISTKANEKEMISNNINFLDIPKFPKKWYQIVNLNIVFNPIYSIRFLVVFIVF